MCIEYHIWINMYDVSTQGVDEHMINVHYDYYLKRLITMKKEHCVRVLLYLKRLITKRKEHCMRVPLIRKRLITVKK